MAIPSVNMFSQQPGGGINAAMGGNNALSQALLDTKIKGVKAQYAPLTEYADAVSKMAYSRLVGMQPANNLMKYPGAWANLTDDQKKQIIDNDYRSGTGNPTPASPQVTENPFSSAPTPQQNFSLSGWLSEKMKNVFGDGQPPPQDMPQSSQNAINGVPAQSELGMATNAWMQSPEAEAQAKKDGMYSTPPQDQLLKWYQSKQNGAQGGNQGVTQGTGDNRGMSYDQSGNNVRGNPADAGRQQQPTYVENEAAYKGIVKEGEELGTARGKDIADIGKQQLDLSNSGVILDRLTGITQNPEFQNMRSQVPYFQDKQLWYLSKQGNREQQKMIGDFISTAQAFKASTVNSFKGKALEKEFNLADKIKIDENDTMGVAEGKLRSLKTLKQIAESKNDIILGLMTDKHMNLGQATKIANKQVDTSAIEKQVDSTLNPQPAEHDIQYMMQKRNLPRAEIVKQLQAKGYKNVS